MSVFAFFALAGFGCITPVLSHPASPLAVAVATEQFKNAKLVPDVLPTFAPTGLLTLNYTGQLNRTAIGDVWSKDAVSAAPVAVYIHGTAEAEATPGSPFNVTTHKYTVLMIDAGVPGSNSSDGYNLHWLANDWTYGVNADHTVTLNQVPDAVVAYAGPNPPSGSGPHRYVTLVYSQPDNFTAPSTPAKGSGVALFNLAKYRQDSGLGAAICGTYFTVQVGFDTTVSVASTTAVVSTTLPQYTPTSVSASSSGAATPSSGSQGNSAQFAAKFGIAGLGLTALLTVILL